MRTYCVAWKNGDQAHLVGYDILDACQNAKVDSASPLIVSVEEVMFVAVYICSGDYAVAEFATGLDGRALQSESYSRRQGLGWFRIPWQEIVKTVSFTSDTSLQAGTRTHACRAFTRESEIRPWVRERTEQTVPRAA